MAHPAQSRLCSNERQAMAVLVRDRPLSRVVVSMTRPHPKGKHNRLKAEDAAREKANPTEYATEERMNTEDEDKHMARPKSSEQNASNEAMRRKVAGEHQADTARHDQVQRRGQDDEVDASDQAERARREGPGRDPNKPAGSIAAEADADFGTRKSDEQPHVGQAGREPFRNREAPNDFKSENRPADIHGMQAEVNAGPKASKDQKPTAEFNIAVALHPELLDPNREATVKAKAPAKRMFISDDLAAELSYKFAHHEISYTETGIMVRSGGESIMIDEAKIGKIDGRADLRRYLDTLPVVRHG